MKEFLEIFRNPELFELFKERPGWFVAFTCVLAFLFRTKINFEFLDSLCVFLNKVSQGKRLALKAICENPLASEEIKNSAKGQLDAIEFRNIYGIKTEPQLVNPLLNLINSSRNPKQMKWDIRRSSNFLERGYDDLPEIRSEEISEKYLRYYCNFYGSFFLVLLILFFYIFVYSDLQFKFKILMCILMITIGNSSVMLFYKAGYVHSLKRIKDEVALIRNNKNRNKKSKLKSWFHN
jgi:magnesium-transporting ATPase (P-type)